MPKVLEVDTYDREGPGHDEKVLAEKVEGGDALRIVEALQRDPRRPPDKWYRVVDDEYKPRVFEP